MPQTDLPFRTPSGLVPAQDLGHQNLWSATAPAPVATERLGGDTTVDLVVIGAGFSGLSAALHAAEAGLSVLVIEARAIGHGGSGRNVGLVNAGLWLPPGDVEAALGPDQGGRLNAALAAGPALVFELIARHGIACEAVPNGTLHCAHSARGQADLARRRDQLVAKGAPVVLLERAAAQARVGSAAVHGALFDPRAGTVQPLAYARGLARAATEAGARIVEGLTARAWAHDGRAWQVETPEGRITAAALLEATNAYATGPQSGGARYTPMHYFQAATAPLPAALRDAILPGREGCWDTATVMSSWRFDAAGRLLIGAIGSIDHPAGAVHRAWAARKLAQLFPALKGQRFSHCWHGRIAATGDHLPKIQRLGPQGYAVFGYSGRGISPGTVFGRAVAQAVARGSEAGLPLDPIGGWQERGTLPRAVYYESGALATHLVDARL